MPPSRRTLEMPRTWRALPLPTAPEVFVKAPTHAAFLDQEHYGPMFMLPRDATAELPIARSLMDAIQDINALKPGQRYIVERYPQGLSVTMPSGWKAMIPYDVKKGIRMEAATSTQPKGNPARNGGRRKATA